MVMFDDIEEIFKNVREFNEYTKALVTLATATVGFRLYVWSQYCCRSLNYSKKYGQWAVISGSTDGIGLAMAKDLARRGHSIVVIGRNEEKLARTKIAIEEEPNVGEVITVKIDLSDASPQNFDRIKGEIDPDNRDIGILINNAGTFTDICARFTYYDMSCIRDTVNVNVIATLYLTRMILPGMLKRRRGLIMNVSSLLGSIPGPYMNVYSATKAFINNFSRTLQLEYSSYPIDIINLTPGAVHTKLFTAIAQRAHKPSPLNPTPDDFAKTALNAVSTRIRFISGCIVHALGQRMVICFDNLGLLHFIMKIAFLVEGVKIQPDPDEKDASSSNQEQQESQAVRT